MAEESRARWREELLPLVSSIGEFVMVTRDDGGNEVEEVVYQANELCLGASQPPAAPRPPAPPKKRAKRATENLFFFFLVLVLVLVFCRARSAADARRRVAGRFAARDSA